MQEMTTGVIVDLSKMTLEELENSRNITRDLTSKTSLDNKQDLAILNHIKSILNQHILMRKLIKHKYSGRLSD